MNLLFLCEALVLAAFRLCGAQTVILDPKNKSEADHLYVIDKGIGSTFLNANPLHVESLVDRRDDGSNQVRIFDVVSAAFGEAPACRCCSWT